MERKQKLRKTLKSINKQLAFLRSRRRSMKKAFRKLRESASRRRLRRSSRRRR